MKYRAVAIGCSSGGLRVLRSILGKLHPEFPISIVLICHVESQRKSLLAELLSMVCPLPVVETSMNMKMEPSKIYVAPPTYHMFLEPDLSFSFSLDEKVKYSRPSIDVLFESMAIGLGPSLIGVILTGANDDGAEGLKKIKDLGGTTIIQNPNTSEVATMPQSALELTEVDYIKDGHEIAYLLYELSQKSFKPNEI